ncbi:DUF3772 domain-containing protein [uncultured Roseobacter sp.]|uniref:DUF3772 domain-containing protein n=1 Tax=uncultured Roseobacter sp. TaxID=114847 RepID=UPI00260E8303|nr:DUF3772 domain-containing protein [uncultured Roseobacter sp.]
MRTILLRILLPLCLALWACAAAAQGTIAEDNPIYPFWDNFASQAEERVANANDSNDEFEELRARIAEFRAEFSTRRSANAERIATLKAQIEALGPVPESGEEPEDIASRRAELNAQLETLSAPVRVADEAFSRANGLIGEIDTIIRERQTRRLLSLGPSPLNPLHWPQALSDMGRVLTDFRDEIRSLGDPVRQQQMRDRLPLVLLLMVVALTLIIRGRPWAGRALSWLRQWGGRGTGVWSFLVSLFRIILPLLGLLLLTHAIRLTGMAGSRMDQILELIPVFGAILLGFRWVAERLFSRHEDDALIPLSDENRARARFYMLLLSLLFVSRGLVDLILGLENAAPASLSVVAFPIVLLMGMVLFLLGFMLRGYRVEADPESEEPARGAGIARVLRVSGTIMVVVAVTAPVMAAAGYAEAGNALLYPTIVSLVVLSLVMILQRFLADVYGLVTGQGTEAREGLAAIFAGFVLVLAALPMLALAWGARVADLTELWTIFLRGFDIGGTRISPGDFLTFAIIFAIGYTITRLIQSTLRQNVLPKTKIDIGGQNALVSGVGYVGIFLAALIAITGAGIDLSAFAIVAGALSVGIGFGLQTIVSNFVSGIILLVERPISEGDWIEVGGQMGYVRHISVRSTRIETFDRTDVIVPNSDLISGTVTNYTRGNTVGRLIVRVGVAYGTDTKRVDAILREIAEAQPMVLRNPPPNIVFFGFGADSLDFEIRVILRDVNWTLSVQNDINHAIAERFAKEGIEIPFAQRDIWLRNPEALREDPK